MKSSIPISKPYTDNETSRMVYDLVVKGISAQLPFCREIEPENMLKEELGLPSMKMVMFFTDVTMELGINIMDFADYELLRLRTVADVTNLLISKLR